MLPLQNWDGMRLVELAQKTFRDIEHGFYIVNGRSVDLRSATGKAMEAIIYYPPSSLEDWFTAPPSLISNAPQISLLEISTLEGVKHLKESGSGRVGALNFANAVEPGGGVLRGAVAQEESLARSSTLYVTLNDSEISRQFYDLHNKDQRHGFYTHAMILSPGVLVFRNDRGDPLEVPYEMDVVTSPAVYAGQVREDLHRWPRDVLEPRINDVMQERMARILYLFESRGIQRIILGSFGTGAFENDVRVVANSWAKLLKGRFKNSFSEVLFAILGRPTYEEFSKCFNETMR